MYLLNVQSSEDRELNWFSFKTLELVELILSKLVFINKLGEKSKLFFLFPIGIQFINF